MNFRFRFLRMLSVLALACATLPPCHAYAEVSCSGHKFLPTPRAETSCRTLIPQLFVSPDRALHASVLAVDVSLYATPDMESRVVIRSSDGNTLTSMDHSSPRGTNGYYIYAAGWSPDSQFFVYSLTSSGGHSPWSFPIMVFSRKQRLIAKFSDMINGLPTLSGHFKFSGPHSLTASTWKKTGALDDQVPISVDLDKAFARLKPSSH